MVRHLPVSAAILFLSISPLAASNASAQNPEKLPRLTKLLFLPPESGGSIAPSVVAEPRDVTEERAAGDASPSGTEPGPIVAPQVPGESNPPGLAGERS